LGLGRFTGSPERVPKLKKRNFEPTPHLTQDHARMMPEKAESLDDAIRRPWKITL
jgi:hypothetical protein